MRSDYDPTRPRISIAMAARNYAQYIQEAIDSVLAQTYENWELIIIDDGSTDDTAEVVRGYLIDHRIRYLKSDSLGVTRAKNLALGMSSGEIVAFLDADDVWLPTKLQSQLDLLDANPEIGVCFTARQLIDPEGRELPTCERFSANQRGDILLAVFRKNFVCFSSVMVRRTVMEHVGGFDNDLDLAIDFDLWLRLASHYQFEFIDEPLVRYRTGHGNLSKKLSDRVSTAVSIMTRALFRRGLSRRIPRRDIGEGYASTCRTLGYVLRNSEPIQAMRWYWRAARWSHRPAGLVRGVLACAARWASCRRTVAAENATVNR